MVQDAVNLVHRRASSWALNVSDKHSRPRSRCLTFWLMRSSSSSLMPSFRFMSLTSARCWKTCFSMINISFLASSRCRTKATNCRASSNSLRSLRSFSALCASLPRVLRICRTSRLRKHTYGSPSSVSWPVSNCFASDFVQQQLIGETHLESYLQRMIASAHSPLLPVFVYVFGKPLYMFVYSSIKTVFNLGV